MEVLLVDTHRSLMEGAAALPAAGRVLAGDRPSLPFFVADGAGDEVGAISAFLTHLALCDVSPLTCRSYAHDLLRWWRLLSVLGVDWTNATTAEVAVLVGWLRSARNGQRQRRSELAPRAVNPKTGKASCLTGTRRRRSTTIWRRCTPSTPSTLNMGVDQRSTRSPSARNGAPCWRTGVPSTSRRRSRVPRSARRSPTACPGPSRTRCGRSCTRP